MVVVVVVVVSCAVRFSSFWEEKLEMGGRAGYMSCILRNWMSSSSSSSSSFFAGGGIIVVLLLSLSLSLLL